jgi:hypothetical protein
MGVKKDQHKAGAPERPRGQQTGFAGNPDKSREAKRNTPALRGRRKAANEMFADESSQHVGTSPDKPRTNTPSIPAQVGGGHIGETGGEIAFKKRRKNAK